MRAVIITSFRVLFKAWWGSDHLCDFPVEEAEEHWFPFHPKLPGLQQDVGSCGSTPALPGGFGIFSSSSCWDILGWGTLSVPWDLLPMLNSTFKLSIHSITWLNSSSALISAPPSCSYWCHSHTVLWEQRDNKSKNKFFPKKKIPLTGSPAINSGIKKAWESAVTMLL